MSEPKLVRRLLAWWYRHSPSRRFDEAIGEAIHRGIRHDEATERLLFYRNTTRQPTAAELAAVVDETLGADPWNWSDAPCDACVAGTCTQPHPWKGGR